MRCLLLALITVIALHSAVHAAGYAPTPPENDWSFDGITGHYDPLQLQRGLKVYKEICAACHSMDLLYYRNLADLGYSEVELKAIASQYTVTDGPDEDGNMFERPARPSDKFVAPFPNANAARAANNGAYPPDMSLLAKARAYGADYLKAVLTGYEDAPEGFELGAGQYYNRYMAGHRIAMAPPLGDGYVSYEDGSPETLEQYAADVSAFMMWAAEPNLPERKQAGLKVMIFLAIMTVIFYLAKRKIWKNLK